MATGPVFPPKRIWWRGLEEAAGLDSLTKRPFRGKLVSNVVPRENHRGTVLAALIPL
jgi:hypothetical protein